MSECHGRLNVAEVVGATSSEGFLVNTMPRRMHNTNEAHSCRRSTFRGLCVCFSTLSIPVNVANTVEPIE